MNAGRPFDPLDLVWRWGTSPALAVALGLVAFAFVLVVAIVPQAPVAASTDTSGYARWVASLPEVWQNRLVTWEASGVFRLFQSPVFRLYLTFLAFYLALMAGSRLHDAYRRWQETRGWHLTWDTLAYAGALLIVAGATVTARWGWQVQPFPLVPQQLVTLQTVAGEVQLRLDSLQPLAGRGAPLSTATEDVRVSQGDDADYVGQVALAVAGAGQPMAAGALPIGRPLVQQGVAVRLVAVDPLATVRATTLGGQPLAIQILPAGTSSEAQALLFSSELSEQTFVIPSRRLTGRLLAQPGGPSQATTTYRLELYRGTDTQPALVADAAEKSRVEMDEVLVAISPGFYGWFVVHRDPGAPAILAGLVLLLCGLGATTALPGEHAAPISTAPRGALRFGVPLLLLVLGCGILVALPSGFWPAAPLGSWSGAWSLARNLLLASGWAGLALTVGSSGAGHWTETLHRAGWWWLSGGMVVGAIGNWLSRGDFWLGGPWEVYPLLLWVLGLTLSLIVQLLRRDGGLRSLILGVAGLAAWAVAVLGQLAP